MQRKKLTRKDKQQQARELQQQARAHEIHKTGWEKIEWYLSLAVAVTGFLLYLNTANHGYVLDDYSIIKENRLTRQGWDAFPEILTKSYRFGYYFVNDELYRPVVKAMFAIEWALAPDNPSLGHWINILLYALTGFMLVKTLSKYFKADLPLVFAVSLLFIAHPIHTEVVANIKSRDEILSLLFGLFAFSSVHDYTVSNRFRALLCAMIFYLLSLMSKESGITFIAVFPLLIYFFTNASRSQLWRVTFSMLSIGILFILLRNSILGNHLKETFSVADNLLMAAQSPTDRFATAVYILGIYLFNILIPVKLVFDKSFNEIPVVSLTDYRFLISFMVYLLLAVFALVKFRKKNFLSFSVWFYLVTLSIFSNIFIIIGTSYGERLMYIPSLGFCLAAGFFINKFSKPGNTQASLKSFISGNKKYLILLLTILALYSYKTVSRNLVWKNNLTLFSNDVKLAPNSTRTHYYLGNYWVKPENIGVDPTNTVRMNRVLDSALVELKRALEIYPGFCDVYKQIGVAYDKKNELRSAFDYYNKAIACNPTDAPSHSNMGTIYFKQGNYAESAKAFIKAITLDPNYTEALANLGSAYGMMQQYDDALVYLHRCIKTDPGYAQAYYFLSITYKFKGDQQNADFYMQKFQALGGKM